MPPTTRTRLRALAVALAATAALSLRTSADDAAPRAAAEKQLASITWLAGSWSGPMWGGEFATFYSTPEGGKLLSVSELVKGGKVAYHEFERWDVREGPNGGPVAVVMQPYPKGAPAGAFALASLDEKARKAVFENPKKDFPTRITYQRVAEDRLVITLSDPYGKGAEEEVFDLKRR